MNDFFDLKNTRYDLRGQQLLKLRETSTSRYGTKTLCFKGSLIRNTVPNKIKNIDNIEDFKKHIKGWKPTTCSCKLSVITVNCNFGFFYISTWFCWYLLNYFQLFCKPTLNKVNK